jgi:hypothetical protein
MLNEILIGTVVGMFGGGCFLMGRWWELRSQRFKRNRTNRETIQKMNVEILRR